MQLGRLAPRVSNNFLSTNVLQAELLDAAAALVRPGGVLVYSTCSIEPEENQQQVGARIHSAPFGVVYVCDLEQAPAASSLRRSSSRWGPAPSRGYWVDHASVQQ